jgi:hypothetical protein
MAALAVTLFAQQPRVKRASLEAMEKSADQRILHLVEDSFALLGKTRGIYLDGYGAVLTAELNLAPGPTLNPFRQSISKEDVARVRARKLERLPGLRQTMREVLLATAASLDQVPGEEKIVFGVTLMALPYEDVSGMPSQIVMLGQKNRLIEAKLGKAPVDAVVRAQEF